ncbi:MAG: GWxTD domain-containing protein [Gemmatimonadaceae bacterium]
MLRADSMAVAGDTARAIAVLDSLVRREPKNAAAWNRLGVLAWTFSHPQQERGKFVMSARTIALRDQADSALRIAARLAPDSGRYQMDLGRLFLQDGVSTMRVQAAGTMERALERAEAAGDSLLIAEAADEAGMVQWRRYEAVEHRRGLTGGVPFVPAAMRANVKTLPMFLDQYTMVYKPPLGADDYERAAANFTRALSANPNNPRALRHAFMALTARNQWGLLREAADVRLKAAPWDPWAWLARGLASHRLDDPGAATAAYDSALSLLTPADRSRFTRLSRLLRRADSTSYAGMAPAALAELERVYWLVADPLTLTPGNEYWLEFLSRVTYAELRWTSEDLGLRGADTDRGDIYIRYGPPPVAASFGPDPEQKDSCYTPPGEDQSVCTAGTDVSDIKLAWYYPATGLNFVFTGAPAWGVSRLHQSYDEIAADARQAMPARWDNLPINRHPVDSIVVQLARFRGGDPAAAAGADSVDVLLFADVPVSKLVAGRRGGETVAVDVAFSAYDARSRMLVRDSARQMVDPARPEAAERRAWRRRLPTGSHLYRVEALEPDSVRAARALGGVTLERARGFGMSDVLVTERVQPKTGQGGAAERWSDFLITPSVGRVPSGHSIALLWESYDLAARDGAAKYRVAVSLTPEGKRGLAALAARVVGGIKEAVGRSAQGKDRVTITYDREAPSRPALVDYLTLDLRGAPAGAYTVTVEVTDLVTNRSTSRQRGLVIEK